jgi:hypothetical protein
MPGASALDGCRRPRLADQTGRALCGRGPDPFVQTDSGSRGHSGRPDFIEADRPEILLEPDSGS